MFHIHPVVDLGKRISLPPIESELVVSALTHSSFAKEHSSSSYERLEFLGDSVLSFIIADELYSRISANEGILTTLRSKLVQRDTLAQKAIMLELDGKILFGNGGIKESGPKNENILEDVFESIIGAIYLSNGLDVTRNFVLKVFAEELSIIKDLAESGDLADFAMKNDPRGLLQTTAHNLNFGDPIYEFIETKKNGSDFHIAEISFSKTDIFKVKESGKTKKLAAKLAAEAALKKLASLH